MRLLVPILAAALGGCAPSPWKLLQQGQKTADILLGAQSEVARKSLPLPGRDLAPECASSEAVSTLHRRLPNPVFPLYVAERLLGQSLIPAWNTRFHLYPPPTPWALPEEWSACERVLHGRAVQP